MIRWRAMKSWSSASCCCATGTSCPAAGCSCLARCQAAMGSPPFSREATRRNSSCVACSSRIAIASSRSGTNRDALVELELLLEFLPAEPEGSLAARRQVLFEVLDQAADRGGGFGGSIRQIAQEVQVAQVAKRAREVVVDESQGAREGSPARPSGKCPGGSLTLSRADWIIRGTCRSFECTRRARSASGA